MTGPLDRCRLSVSLADRTGYSQYQVRFRHGLLARENTGHGTYRTLVVPAGL